MPRATAPAFVTDTALTLELRDGAVETVAASPTPPPLATSVPEPEPEKPLARQEAPSALAAPAPAPSPAPVGRAAPAEEAIVEAQERLAPQLQTKLAELPTTRTTNAAAITTSATLTRPEPGPPRTLVADARSGERELDGKSKSDAPEVRARPKYRRNPEPTYPSSARRRRQEGLVVLAVTVSAEGKATRLAVQKSSGHTALDEAALKSVSDWEFEPAYWGHHAVTSAIEVPVRFQLGSQN